MNALGVALVGCVLQVTLFALAVGAIYAAACRRDPERAVRTVLGGMVGVALLTAACWSPWPNWSNVLASAAPSVEVEHRDEARTSATTAGEPASPVNRPATSAASDLSVATSASTLGSLWEGMRQVWSGEVVPERTVNWTWLDIVTVAFLLAAVLGLTRLAVGWTSVARLARGGIPMNEPRLMELVDTLRAELGCTRNIVLIECGSLATAATIGWRHARILLPSSWRQWSAAELRAVLAHEIAHVGRGDFGTHLVAQVGLALHSYHPLVHWLAGRLRLAQELAADAAAARVAGGRRSYLMTLAGLALAQPATRVAWPAQAFIPSRHMFLRRIEMLRDQKAVGLGSGAASVRGRIVGWLAVAALCAVGLGVVGLRPTNVARAQTQVAGAESAAKSTTPKNDKTEYDFSYVPENAMAFVAIRQAELAADPRLRPLLDLWEENTRPGLPSKLVEQATLLLVAPEFDEKGNFQVGSGGEQIVIHTTEPVDFRAYLKKGGYPDITTAQDGGRELLVMKSQPAAISFFMPNKQTLVGKVRAGLNSLLNRPNAANPPADAATWNTTAQGPILMVAKSAHIRDLVKGQPNTPTIMIMMMPLLNSADTFMLWVEPKDDLRIIGRISCKSPDDAKRVVETLNGLAGMAENAVQMQENSAAAGRPGLAQLKPIWELAKSGLAKRKVTANDKNVDIEVPLGKTAESVKLIAETLTPPIKAARATARQNVNMSNLRQIALAMHNYADANKHFPPAVLIGPDGKTPYSWRVALLPLLGYDALYKQYRFNEPWDSAENRKVLEQMPTVYRHPNNESAANSSYFVLTGPDTVFPDGKGTSPADITDGTSTTILAIEAKRDIPWTKPEDIVYTANGPAPQLGGWSERGANVAFCDGSVRFLANDVDEKLLRAMISKAGGERIDGSNLDRGATSTERMPVQPAR